MNWMKLKTKRDLSYIVPLTVEFFQNNGRSSISVILLTNRWMDGQMNERTDGQTNGREFNTSLAEVKIIPVQFRYLCCKTQYTGHFDTQSLYCLCWSQKGSKIWQSQRKNWLGRHNCWVKQQDNHISKKGIKFPRICWKKIESENFFWRSIDKSLLLLFSEKKYYLKTKLWDPVEWLATLLVFG